MVTEKLLQTGFYNNRYTKASQIKISPDNLAIGRGYAAFEFFRVINGQPFYLERHLDRFFNTLHLLRLNINYSRPQLIQIFEEIIHKNGQPNCFIKIYALPGNSLQLEQTSRLLILPVDIAASPDLVYDQGVCLLFKEYARFLPEAKSTNYLPAVFWQNEMDAYNAFDVLYYSNNQVHESSRGNVFIVKKGKICTPNKDILKGITKSIVSDIIKSRNFPFEERPIFKDELLDADEVFITSTTKLVLPVVKIDTKLIADGKPGKITMELYQLFCQHLISWNQVTMLSN